MNYEIIFTIVAIASAALIGWFAKAYSISNSQKRTIEINVDATNAIVALDEIKKRAEEIFNICGYNGFYIPGTKALAFYNFLTEKKAPNCMPLYDLQILWAEFIMKEELSNQ